jgi:hypothetical protein
MGFSQETANTFSALSKIIAPVAKGFSSIYGARAGGGAFETHSKSLRAEAGFARTAAKYRAKLIREQGDEFQSTQTVIAGGQGVTMEGSTLDVLADTAYKVERNALMEELKGDLKAKALELEGSSYDRLSKMRKGGAWLKAAEDFSEVFSGLSKWHWTKNPEYKKLIKNYDWDVTGTLR